MRIVMLALLVGGCAHRVGRSERLRLDTRVLPQFQVDLEEEDATLPEEDCSAAVIDVTGKEVTVASLIEIEAVPGSTSKIIQPGTKPEALLEGDVFARCHPMMFERLYVTLTGGDQQGTDWLIEAKDAEVKFEYRSTTIGLDSVPQITEQTMIVPQPVQTVSLPAVWVVEFPTPVRVSEGQRLRFILSATFGPQPHGGRGLTPSPSDTVQAHVIMASWTDDVGSPAKDIMLEPPFSGPSHDYIESIGSL